MSTVAQPKQAKDVFSISPDQLVLDRDWNGRWTAVSDEPGASTDAGKEDGKRFVHTDLQSQTSIRELAKSIKEHGQLEDILVCKRPPNDQGLVYHVVAGQSRTRAMLLLASEEPNEDHKIRCRLLSNVDDQQAFLINEEENRKRNNLTLLDKSYCMKRERDLGLTLEEISTRWGCSIPAVNQALTLIDAPEEVKVAVYDKILSATDVITSLKGLDENDQIEIVNRARKAKADGTIFKSHQIKELARQYVKPAPAPAATATHDAGVSAPGVTSGTVATPSTPTTPEAPKKKGRPAPAEKRTPRSVADLRKAIKDRKGVVSQTLVRYFAGYADTTDEVLNKVLDSCEYEDATAASAGDHADQNGQNDSDEANAELELTPRTEGNQ